MSKQQLHVVRPPRRGFRCVIVTAVMLTAITLSTGIIQAIESIANMGSIGKSVPFGLLTFRRSFFLPKDEPEKLQQPRYQTENNSPSSYLEDTAIVTLATGDAAARAAVALMASLRAVKTKVPHLVVLLSRGGLGSKDCNDYTWKLAHGREEVPCGASDNIAPEIISQVYLDALHRMHVETVVVDPIPDTPYTVIPGGRQIFWGMAFNKLHVFNMTQYRKLLWMDSDTLVLKNMDHLLKLPMFTAAFTYDCCNPNGPPKPSGGLWVVEPSREVAKQLLDLISGPVPGTVDTVWHWGDMQVVQHLFGKFPPKNTTESYYWPFAMDLRHGYVPGLKYFPQYDAMSDEEFNTFLMERVPQQRSIVEGFLNETADSYPMQQTYVWRTLDTRYDQCVGQCECLPGRDMPKLHMSVHFSCIQRIRKPGEFESEHELMHALYNNALSCTRYYYLLWYEKYVSAVGRLPEPLWEGPSIPLYNATHDEYVAAWRLANPQ